MSIEFGGYLVEKGYNGEYFELLGCIIFLVSVSGICVLPDFQLDFSEESGRISSFG